MAEKTALILAVAWTWFIGWQATYIYIISKYMKHNKISSMQDVDLSSKEGGFSSKLFLILSYQWPLFWLKEQSDGEA